MFIGANLQKKKSKKKKPKTEPTPSPPTESMAALYVIILQYIYSSFQAETPVLR